MDDSHPTVLRQPKARRNSGDKTDSVPAQAGLSTPKTVYDIPGLGPIRGRALTKAGLSDLKVLKSATIEQLVAVPGMSEIKARQIQQFLGGFSDEALELAGRAAASAVITAEPLTSNWDASVGSDGVRIRLSADPGMDAAVVREGEKVFNAAVRLLMTESATGYRARLLRETIGFIQAIKVLLQYSLAEPKARERAVKRLQGVYHALESALSGPEMDRKAQTRLADELAQACDRLQHLIGQTPRRRGVETDDE